MVTEPAERAMDNSGLIDTTFDFRSDTPPGGDPDERSPTLRRYHKLLWSKPLPTGKIFVLDDTKPRVYLYHRSEFGEFFLSSDTVIPWFTKERRIANVVDQIPLLEMEAFKTASYTIGGMMIFPGNRIDGRMTINQGRGFDRCIKDRFDLTVECIRRYYRNESSPLNDTLLRYVDFFALFRDFRGYVDFFFLQDLVTDDYAAVRFFTPFTDFEPWPLPKTTDAYKAYMQCALNFIQARNERIRQSV